MQVRSIVGAGVVSVGVGAAVLAGAGSAFADSENSNGPRGDSTTSTVTKTTIKDSYNKFTDRSVNVSVLNGNRFSAFNGNFSGNTVKVSISAGNGILRDGIGNGNVLKNLFNIKPVTKFPVTVVTNPPAE